jgi:predicted acylesterase/phospholipase RssA
MPIKHLVISGGGPAGLAYLGALTYLNEQQFWNISDIESIYATSIGTIIGAFICLKYDWGTLNKYIIERPWHEAFKLSGQQIFDSYYKKGLYDKKMIEIVFKPLLEAKDLSLNITLQELFQYSKIDLHIFTFDVNKFITVELSHTSHPDLLLVEALTMSCGIPGIIIPTIMNGGCFIDGGVLCNFPINECLRDHDVEEEVLGINYLCNNSQVSVTSDSTLLEYIMAITINATAYIKYSVNISTIKNTVLYTIDEDPLSPNIIKKSIHEQTFRKELFEQGVQLGQQFLETNVKLT